MSDTDTLAIPAIVLRRTYAAPRERVYEAWTDPQIAARFLGPNDTQATDIRMDVRPGGTYRITMVHSDGERMSVGGTYRDVRPPERIAFTWRWEEDDPALEVESLVTLEFHDRDGHTEFVLRHEQFAQRESRDNHERGWTAIVDQLGSIF